MSWINTTFIAVGFLILIGSGIALGSMVYAVVSAGAIEERLNTYGVIPDVRQRKEERFRTNRLSRARQRLNRLLSVLASEELNLQLNSANWPISETEYILIRLWVTAAGFLLAWLLSGSILPGIGMAIIAYIIPSIILNQAIHNRRQAFEKQLIDVLVLLTGAVRSGYSLQQALDFVVREMKPPASDEFKRVLYEVSLAQPLNQALINLTVRMQNDDLYLLVTALNINAQVGGNMVLMLKSVTDTIRDRIRLFGEIRSLTSSQRFNSFLLTMLPFGIAAVLFIFNPNYMERVLQPNIWLCFPVGALVSIIIGNIVIRRLAKIDV